MSGKPLTPEAVKECFCTTDKRATLKAIREQLDEVWDIDKAAELTANIGDRMEEIIKKEGAEWPPVERILWTVKEAFILGALDAVATMIDANAMCYAALTGEEADA